MTYDSKAFWEGCEAAKKEYVEQTPGPPAECPYDYKTNPDAYGAWNDGYNSWYQGLDDDDND